MVNSQLYLASSIPQWFIFGGVGLLTAGFVDKRIMWTRLGWISLLLAGLAAMYFNLFGGLQPSVEPNNPDIVINLIITTGWQAAAGSLLACATLVLQHLKSKRYSILAILTVAYFILIFFLYTQISGGEGKIQAPGIKTEKKQQ